MFLAFILLLQTDCQHVDTTAGRITAAHCGSEKFEVSFTASDLRITSFRIEKNAVKLSMRPPVFFRCRRGTRYDVKVVHREKYRFFVDRIFYPGESGSPVFDADGNCCGIVLGNTFHRGRWIGRVASFEQMRIFSSRSADRQRLPNPQKQLLLESAVDSILE